MQTFCGAAVSIFSEENHMLTVNGAAALNLLGCGAGRLEKGGPADFCVLPENLTY